MIDSIRVNTRTWPEQAATNARIQHLLQELGEFHPETAGVQTLAQHADVVIESVVADNEVLAYHRDANEWRNKTLVEAGIAAITHKDEHDPEDGADALNCAAPSELASVQAAGEGSSHSFARADHAHQIQHGIDDNRIVTIDHAAVADDDYAKFTANGLEGRSFAEVRADINVADGAIANIVEDTTPQLGGDLDVNGKSIVSVSNGDILLTPHGTGTTIIQGETEIRDIAGNEIVQFSLTLFAVNHFNMTNRATGSGPILSSIGDDADIDLELAPKGSGSIVLDGTTVSAAGLALIDDANAAAQRTTLGLVIGTDVLAEQTIGIADDNLVEIDHAAVADNDYAKFTANGLEGRSYAEVASDIEASIDHDALTNFVANEHVDHSGVSISTGSGLSGGGDITATRTLSLGALTGDWDAGAYAIAANQLLVSDADDTTTPSEYVGVGASQDGMFYSLAAGTVYLDARTSDADLYIRANDGGTMKDFIVIDSSEAKMTLLAPFTASTATVCPSLNADLLDGKHVGTSGNTVPLLDGANTWSDKQQMDTATKIEFRSANFWIGSPSALELELHAGNTLTISIGASPITTDEMFVSTQGVYILDRCKAKYFQAVADVAVGAASTNTYSGNSVTAVGFPPLNITVPPSGGPPNANGDAWLEVYRGTAKGYVLWHEA